MPLFGVVHLSLLALIAAIGVALCWLCRRRPSAARPICLALGIALAVNEIIWWIFRYSHEGFRFPQNLPLQLCDVTLWASAFAALTRRHVLAEFAYFAGLAGAGMALITPDLWSPWPTYPAVYFFLAHGGIVLIPIVLVYGRVLPLRPNAVWRAFGMLIGFALLVGSFNAIFGTNYMYLRQKPNSASALDALGPWPIYLIAGAALALALFWLLWLPARYTEANQASNQQRSQAHANVTR